MLRLVRMQARGKRELRRLPFDEWADQSLDAWLRRFWSLPPEAWKEAVDLRLEERSLRVESALETLTVESKTLLPLEGPFAEDEAEPTAEDLAFRWGKYEERYRTFWNRHFPPTDADQNLTEKKRRDRAEKIRKEISSEVEGALKNELQKIQEELRSESVALSAEFAPLRKRLEASGRLELPKPPKLDRPWREWVEALPEEAQEKGIGACLVWCEMLTLRERLGAAIKERETLLGFIDEAKAEMIMNVRMFELRSRLEKCERYYRTLAGPFFAQYGAPPLIGVRPIMRSERPTVASAPPRPPSEPAPLARIGDDEAWEAWLTRIPAERRSEALRVRVLYDDMTMLRHHLAKAIEEQDRNQKVGLKPRIARLDEEYRKLAEPLFRAHGAPDFINVRFFDIKSS